MRISADAVKLGLTVVEPEAALNAAAWQTGNKFVVKDLFTVRDGHWWADPGQIGYPPQWAVDEYAIPNELGGATMCFVRVLKPDGSPNTQTQVAYWTDGGYERLAQYDGKSLPSWLTLLKPEKCNPKTGWFEFDMNHVGWPYNPDAGAHGPACVIKTPALSAVVKGVGLPYSWHISTFIVFQEVARSTVPDPGTPPDPGAPPASGAPDYTSLLARIAAAQERQADDFDAILRHFGARS